MKKRTVIFAIVLLAAAGLLASDDNLTGDALSVIRHPSELASRVESSVFSLAEKVSGSRNNEITLSSTGETSSSGFSGWGSTDSETSEESPEDSLIINNASTFYYYSQLSEDEQLLYDEMLRVAQNPTTMEYGTTLEIEEDPSTDEFNHRYLRAYDALLYDHPELFWIYRGTCNLQYSYFLDQNSDGLYSVAFHLTNVYDNYESEMTAFKAAADALLADIDPNWSDPAKALAIHNRLTDLVSYCSSPISSEDYVHTAYGALVADSSGNSHSAVCDGYAFAYEYLLQQEGIECTIVFGRAGSADDMENHAWNLVKLDGQWYEVDATWDDQELTAAEDDPDLYMVEDALNDSEFMGRLSHYMYMLTTEEISHFNPEDYGNYYVYETSSGKVSFLSDVYHVRYTEEESEETSDYITDLAPIAYGETYTYEYMIGNG